MPVQLLAALPPIPKDTDEQMRVEHTRLRRRLLYSQFASDLDQRGRLEAA